ncbi:MAG: peptide transporter [Lentisphaeria bacterium]|nr:peptide transporter [Lentisphaeria bacterium]
MSFIDDKELKEYRDVMKPPDAAGFEDGFNWKAVAGAMFLGFIVNPATDYLSLVIGNDANIGGAMKWVIVIFFAEIAKRSFTTLKTQELYVLHYMVGAALADPFSGYLFKQFMAQSEYVMGLGLELPTWAFPDAAAIQAAGRTLFAKAWLPVIGITIFGSIVSRVDNYGLGYILYRLASDVEKLPFPFAPMRAAGIVALAEGNNDEKSWRQRCFAIGGMMGIVWGVIFICVPMVTQVLLPQRIELIPLVFIDFTPQVGKILPAVPFNLVLNFGAFLSGMIVPWWGVVGSFVGLIITWIANPVLQRAGVLSTWEPEMSFIDTVFVNNIDFYLSFGIGLTLAVTFSKLVISASMTLKKHVMKLGGSKKRDSAAAEKELNHSESMWQGIRDGWKILITNNKARGDFSIFGAIAIYLGSTFSWILLGYALIGPRYPWMIMLFYAVVYTPLISYATAKLEGVCGQAVNIPYLRELTILLTGYKGAKIWFAPMPIQNLGAETVGFRVLELTGTKIISQVKTILLTLPIVIVASFMTSEILWRMAPIPSAAYPWTERMWELDLRNRCLMLTSTVEGGSQFLEALHFEYAGWGLLAGTTMFSVLSVLGLPVMLVFGAVWGLGQSNPGALFCTMAGACTAKFYFKRKYKDMWLKYMMVVMAGFGCGMGVTSMIAMSFNVISRMIKPTLW